MIIAIDGPSGAGKSTIAKKLAKRLGLEYIDTGAMYRAFALKVANLLDANKLSDNSDNLSEESTASTTDIIYETCLKILKTTFIDIKSGQIILDGRAVDEFIRTPRISSLASKVSSFKEVREKLVALQRQLGETSSVVMDGRDIGTNVFPGADFKFYMTASVEERAKRRYLELQAKDELQDYDEVLLDIKKRDYDDSTRAINPLVQAEDAILIDTDGLGIEQVVEKLMRYVK